MSGNIRYTIGALPVIFFLVFSVLIAGCLSSPVSPTATLQVTSSPSGAEVYVDNQYRGTTPCTVGDTVPGTHSLELRSAGYTSWLSTFTVSTGSNQVYAALTPNPSVTSPVQPGGSSVITGTTTIAPQTAVTIHESKETMIIGDSNLFYGTAVGCDTVSLTLFGPGYYTYGVLQDQPKVNSLGSWSYTWNKGTSILAGEYTMIVEDPRKTTSDRVVFTVVGGGLVSIVPSTYSATAGNAITFSGQCTTGAKNVLLTLYGPGQFTGGVDLGSHSVLADKTWNFKYSLDSTLPTGTYTMYVYDIPKTTSATTQFTVGFA